MTRATRPIAVENLRDTALAPRDALQRLIREIAKPTSDSLHKRRDRRLFAHRPARMERVTRIFDPIDRAVCEKRPQFRARNVEQRSRDGHTMPIVHDAPWSKSREAFKSVAAFKSEKERFRAVFRLVRDDERLNCKPPRDRDGNLVPRVTSCRKDVCIGFHLDALADTGLYSKRACGRGHKLYLHRRLFAQSMIDGEYRNRRSR